MPYKSITSAARLFIAANPVNAAGITQSVSGRLFVRKDFNLGDDRNQRLVGLGEFSDAEELIFAQFDPVSGTLESVTLRFFPL